MMWLGRFVCFTGGLFVEVVLADVVEDGLRDLRCVDVVLNLGPEFGGADFVVEVG